VAWVAYTISPALRSWWRRLFSDLKVVNKTTKCHDFPRLKKCTVIFLQPWALSDSMICLSHDAAALGYRHTGCLQLSHRWPPEMRGLWTRPRMDVDPPQDELPSAGHIVSPPPGWQLVVSAFVIVFPGRKCCHCTSSKLSTVYIQQRISRSWNATSKGLNILQLAILPVEFVLCYENLYFTRMNISGNNNNNDRLTAFDPGQPG